MAWLYLVVAGCFEVTGVASMNAFSQTKKKTALLGLAVSMFFSFSLLSLAMETLPMGMSYAIWTGIGTIGTTIVGMVVFKESSDWRRLASIALILASVVGLKLFT